MASEGSSAAFEAVGLLAAVVFVVIVAIAVLGYMRRQMRSSMSRGSGSGFDLAQLRRLRDGGQLSAEEYDDLVHTQYADSE